MDKQQRLKALKFYVNNDLDLIPLKKWNAVSRNNGKQIPVGKAPRDLNWRKKQYSHKDIKTAVVEGYNSGWRLGPEDLVLDVDPKNGGDKSLEKIEARFNVRFEEIAPTVITGSGGRHFYFHKDPSIKIREILEDEEGESYPGIEFKTNGRQVVAAGSRHPSGNWYEFDDFAPVNRPLLPADIFQLIIRPSRKDGAASAGKFSPEELAEALEKLEPEDYQDQDKWLTLMMACHHATDGEGSEEFIQWSTSDPEYADHRNIIRMRWDSLHSNKGGEITYKTLLEEIKKAGHTIGAEYDVREDFAEDWEDDDLLSEEEAAEQAKALTAKVNVLDWIMQFNPMAENNKKELNDLLLALSQATGLAKVKGMNLLRTKLKVTKSEMKELMKEASEKFLDDIGEIAVKHVLDKFYNGGKNVIYVNDSQFWAYNGKFWEQEDTTAVGKIAISVAQELREKFDAKIPSRAISSEVEYLMKRMCHADIKVLRLAEEPLPVINCQNGELWLNEDGTFDLVPHKYDSYLTNCLDVDFNPEATCPKWDASIREIFSKSEDPEAMTLYFEEIMGYVMQPRKNIAAWWLLNGKGSNGKSLLSDILAALCGNAALAKPVNELDVARNNHALETLPGKLLVYDDDMDTNIVLPDGILKKISERKLLEVNPKGSKAFSFISTATPIMLTNRLPALKDPSNGTKRRANVIPFDRIFKSEEMDLNLGEYIRKEELPGVLNRALAGLFRLRERGHFMPPEECKLATESFLNRSNTFLSFISDCITKTGDEEDRILRPELYDCYLRWCAEARVKFEVSRNSFYENCRQIGLMEKSIGGRRVAFVGIKVEMEDEDFLEDE